MCSAVHSDEQQTNVPLGLLSEDLLRQAALRVKPHGTRLERRLTELEKAQISQRIKQARIQAGLTQRELADYLNVEARTVANYESSRVPFRLLGKIAEATGTTSEWLLHGAVAESSTPATVEELAQLREDLAEAQAQVSEILRLVRQLAEPE